MKEKEKAADESSTGHRDSTAISSLSQSTGGQDGTVLDRERLLMWLPHVGCLLIMACFLAFALATAASAMELTPETWDDAVAGKTVFVKFLAPW